MLIGVIGLNHKSAELALREELGKVCQRRFDPASSAHGSLSYILLTTCNRSEIYFSSSDLAETHSYILGVLRHDIAIPFEHKIYSYFGIDCFNHLACVTSGIDSAIIGESEIQGQVKKAYETAALYRRLPKELHFLFQKCLKIGKEIRTRFNSYEKLPTLEEAVIKAASDLLGELKKQKILFVGLSEINQKILKNLKINGLENITLCNRTLEKSRRAEEEDQIYLLAWEELSAWSGFDLIVVGTRSPHYLLTPEAISPQMKTPKVIIDLSVPRNVDPRVGKAPLFTLLNVDQLNRTIDRRRKIKAAEIARIESHYISASVERQVESFQEKERFQPLLKLV